jgi:hypothetical protein
MKRKFAFAFIMGTITTGLVSFTLISINIGFGEGFLAVWLRSWSIAMIPALFSILFISPKVQWALNTLSQNKKNNDNEKDYQSRCRADQPRAL